MILSILDTYQLRHTVNLKELKQDSVFSVKLTLFFCPRIGSLKVKIEVFMVKKTTENRFIVLFQGLKASGSIKSKNIGYFSVIDN